MKKFMNITFTLLISAFLFISMASEAFSTRLPDLAWNTVGRSNYTLIID